MNKQSSFLKNDSVLDQKIIENIKMGYKKCREFFSKYDNQGLDLYTKEKKKFLRELSLDFYSQFKAYKDLFSVNSEAIEETIRRHQFVPIIFREGGFEYPLSFTIFMDRIKDINVIPAKIPDFSKLDYFFSSFPSSRGLNDFLHHFYKIVKLMVIPLRKREEMILKTLTNTHFLRQDSQGEYRTTPPSNADVLQQLNLGSKQEKKIERALTLLHSFKICKISGIIMNMSKIGYYYVLVDKKNRDEHKDTNLLPYSVWELDFHDYTSNIYCVPFERTQDLLKDYDYIPLQNWYWNINFHDYNYKNENPWKTFTIPNFLDKNFQTKFNKWPLTELLSWDLKNWEKEVIENLSRINNLSINNLNELSPNTNKDQIIRFVKKLGSDEVFQYYSNINFLDIDFKISFRITIREKDLFKDVIAQLMVFPIAHIFTIDSDQFQEAIGYIHCPTHVVANLIRNFTELKENYPLERFHYSFSGMKKLSRCLNIYRSVSK
ncbi:MAG: hypothetical protein HeimC3_24120 [Candidatus Heimdallarchaeota archaeon LC_3]|nr:MAG: hypothetical protein HeimC3_24120 [Candidatus Heimdallarchaeota archaeon LC_3]